MIPRIWGITKFVYQAGHRFEWFLPIVWQCFYRTTYPFVSNCIKQTNVDASESLKKETLRGQRITNPKELGFESHIAK
jgi:hypothetical protein